MSGQSGTRARPAVHGLEILIVGVNYAPEHAGIGPYTAGMAEHLVVAGHRVTALTAVPHYPAWQVDAAFSHVLRTEEQRDGVRVIRQRIYVPPRQSALHRALYEASFMLAGVRLAGVPRPDAIVGVVPSLSGGVLARLLAARFRTRYGLLFQDLMGPAASQSGITGGGLVSAATRRAERWATKRARVVAAVSTSFFPYLRDLGVREGRLLHLPNWVRIDSPRVQAADVMRTRARLGWAPDEMVVLHSGNMGLKQNAGQIIDAARLSGAGSGGRSVRFVLMGDGSQRSELEETAALVRNADVLPPEPEASYADVLAAADALLITERSTVNDMALPSKLTSYAAAGRPVVAAVNADGATGREVTRAGLGLIVPPEDPRALLAALGRIDQDAELRLRLGAAARTYARTLGADVAFSRVDELVAMISGGTQDERIRPIAA